MQRKDRGLVTSLAAMGVTIDDDADPLIDCLSIPQYLNWSLLLIKQRRGADIVFQDSHSEYTSIKPERKYALIFTNSCMRLKTHVYGNTNLFVYLTPCLQLCHKYVLVLSIDFCGRPLFEQHIKLHSMMVLLHLQARIEAFHLIFEKRLCSHCRFLKEQMVAHSAGSLTCASQLHPV